MHTFIANYKEFSPFCTNSIVDNISDVPIDGKDKVLAYLNSGEPIGASTGYVIDAFTGENTFIRRQIYRRGEFGWSSQVIYYFEKYNLVLLQEFIDFVLSLYTIIESLEKEA